MSVLATTIWIKIKKMNTQLALNPRPLNELPYFTIAILVNIWWDEVEIAAKDLAIPHHLPKQKLCKSINFFQDPKIVLQKNIPK